MSHYLAAMEISSAGMSVERLRLEVAATNIANMTTVGGPGGQVYAPMRVVSRAMAEPRQDFSSLLAGAAGPGRTDIPGASTSVELMRVDPRRVHDPQHPAADADGFVTYPGVNILSETAEIMIAVRAYEANLKAATATRALARAAIEYGAR